MREMEESTTLRDVLVFFFKHKTMILIVFVATVMTVTVRTFLLPPVYEAKSTLLVKFGREYLYRPGVGEGEALIRANFGRMREELTGSEIQILTSRDLMEKVMTTLGVENIYPALLRSPAQDRNQVGDALERFEKHLTAQRVKRSDVVNVSFRHTDPHMAAQAVNVLIDRFKEKRLSVFKDPNTSAFLAEQVAAYRQRLEESEEKLKTFLQDHPNFSHDQQRGLLLAKRAEADAAFKTTRSRIVELQEKLSSLEKQMQTIAENTPLSTEPDAVIDEAKSRLLTLQLREQELLSKFKHQHPQVISIRKEIQQAKALLQAREAASRGRVTTGKNMVHQDIKREMIHTQADLHAQEAKVVVLEQQLAQVDEELQALAVKEKELRDLQRELAKDENNYQTYVAKLEETRLSDEMDRQKIANISVVQAATVPRKPVKPRKRFHIALGVLFGAFTGVGLAFFTEYIGQGLSTPESAERRLGLPVLVAVSYKGR